MRDREERDAVKLHPRETRIGIEGEVEQEVPAFVGRQASQSAERESSGG